MFGTKLDSETLFPKCGSQLFSLVMPILISFNHACPPKAEFRQPSLYYTPPGSSLTAVLFTRQTASKLPVSNPFMVPSGQTGNIRENL